MDWYLIAKFVHILCAMAWIGGGLSLLVLGVMAERAGNRVQFLAVLDQMVHVAPRLFVPGSLVVLVSGLTMIWLGGWMWEAWMVIGLVGVALTSGIGALVLGPTAAGILACSQDPARAHDCMHQGRRFLRLVKLDYVLQFAIVFVMVAKPGLADTGVLIGLAVAVLAGLVATQTPPQSAALG